MLVDTSHLLAVPFSFMISFSDTIAWADVVTWKQRLNSLYRLRGRELGDAGDLVESHGEHAIRWVRFRWRGWLWLISGFARTSQACYWLGTLFTASQLELIFTHKIQYKTWHSVPKDLIGVKMNRNVQYVWENLGVLIYEIIIGEGCFRNNLCISTPPAIFLGKKTQEISKYAWYFAVQNWIRQKRVPYSIGFHDIKRLRSAAWLKLRTPDGRDKPPDGRGRVVCVYRVKVAERGIYITERGDCVSIDAGYVCGWRLGDSWTCQCLEFFNELFKYYFWTRVCVCIISVLLNKKLLQKRKTDQNKLWKCFRPEKNKKSVFTRKLSYHYTNPLVVIVQHISAPFPLTPLWVSTGGETSPLSPTTKHSPKS